MIIVYTRVSTTDQNLDAQIDALTAAGAERFLFETVSGAMAECTGSMEMLPLRSGQLKLEPKITSVTSQLSALCSVRGPALISDRVILTFGYKVGSLGPRQEDLRASRSIK